MNKFPVSLLAGTFAALLGVSEAGAPGAHGAICSTLRDLARYGMLFMPSWRVVATQRVILDAFVERIQEEVRTAIFKAGLLSDKIEEY